ncbi:uncharacterized protein LOC141537503 isoform X1 [Cotesia typhae]|uniref:uncharacterized protein LOC141537503 isoform X1 n=1 Tax=Cotesia typhae TaxID=2053667 RepID=UPI003D68C8FD
MKTGKNYFSSKSESLTIWKYYDWKLNKWTYANCDAFKWSEGRNYIRVKNYVAYYEQRTKWYFDPNADYLYECSGIRANFNPLDLPQGIVYRQHVLSDCKFSWRILTVKKIQVAGSMDGTMSEDTRRKTGLLRAFWVTTVTWRSCAPAINKLTMTSAFVC